MGTGLCSFSQARSLLKEQAQFLVRRPTTAPTAQHLSSVPRGTSLTAFAERACTVLGSAPHVCANCAAFSSVRRGKSLTVFAEIACTVLGSALHVCANCAAFSTVPGRKSLTAFAERAFSCTCQLQKDSSELTPAFSCTCRLQKDVSELTPAFFVHLPTSERTPAGLRLVLSSSTCVPNLLWLDFRQVLSESSLSSAEAPFKGNKLVHLATSAGLKHSSKFELARAFDTSA